MKQFIFQQIKKYDVIHADNWKSVKYTTKLGYNGYNELTNVNIEQKYLYILIPKRLLNTLIITVITNHGKTNK